MNKKLQASRHYDADEVERLIIPVIKALRKIPTMNDRIKVEKLAVESAKRLSDAINYRGFC